MDGRHEPGFTDDTDIDIAATHSVEAKFFPLLIDLTHPPTDADQFKRWVEVKKLQIEAEKLAIERKKLAFSSSRIIRYGAVVTPILVAVLTAFFAIVTAQIKAKLETQSDELGRQARANTAFGEQLNQTRGAIQQQFDETRTAIAKQLDANEQLKKKVDAAVAALSQRNEGIEKANPSPTDPHHPQEQPASPIPDLLVPGQDPMEPVDPIHRLEVFWPAAFKDDLPAGLSDLVGAGIREVEGTPNSVKNTLYYFLDSSQSDAERVARWLDSIGLTDVNVEKADVPPNHVKQNFILCGHGLSRDSCFEKHP